MKKTVITVKELSKRWNLSRTTLYALNKEGKLPHLPFAENKFPLRAIELIDEDPNFNFITFTSSPSTLFYHREDEPQKGAKSKC